MVKGFIDIHVHSAPDLIPRKADDIELAQRAIPTAVDGYVMKSHYFCTADRAKLISELFPGCSTYGALVLNHSVGGLNSTAVELAAKAGAKIVWFPTCDALHEKAIIENSKTDFSKKPAWAKIRLALQKENEIPYISVLNDDGSFSDGVIDVLNAIKRTNVALATGHISPRETMALVCKAHSLGIKKIIVTHVTFPSTFFTPEQQEELVSLGATMEHCFTTYSTGKVNFETIVEHIRRVGAANIVLSTDLGQKTGIYPEEGMLQFADDLLSAGFSEKDIQVMMSENPRKLLGI